MNGCAVYAAGERNRQSAFPFAPGSGGRLAPRRVQGGALPPEAFSFPFLAAFARES